tara:strand:+ start:2127 stop:2399 length:273 start_codon:yes stop_codon:yes gene_type:complete
MKILDDLTNKVIENKDCVELSFYPHSIERNAATTHKTFKPKKFYISIETAETIVKSLSSIEPNQSNVHIQLVNPKKNELDQVKLFDKEAV